MSPHHFVRPPVDDDSDPGDEQPETIEDPVEKTPDPTAHPISPDRVPPPE